MKKLFIILFVISFQISFAQNLKVKFPNGGETFFAGKDTTVVWEDLLKKDSVTIEYSTDGGDNWFLISDLTKNYQTLWKSIPKKQSNNCLIRITSNHVKNILPQDISRSNGFVDDYAIAYHPSGEYLAIGGRYGLIHIIEAKTLKTLKVINAHRGYIYSINFSLDGNLLLSSAEDSTAKVWEFETGNIKRTFYHPDAVYTSCFSPDAKKIISGCENQLYVWDMAKGNKIRTLAGHNGTIFHVQYSPDSTYIVSADYFDVRFIDANNYKFVKRLEGNMMFWAIFAISPDNKKLVTVCNDSTIQIWDLETMSNIKTWKGHNSYIRYVKFTPDGKYFATSGGDSCIKVWDTDSLQLVYSVSNANNLTYIFAISPDGKVLVAPNFLGSLSFFDMKTGVKQFDLGFNSEYSYNFALSSDKKKLATYQSDSLINIFETSTGNLIKQIKNRTYVAALAFNNDDSKLVAAVSSFSSRVFDLNADTVVCSVIADKKLTMCLAVSHDGKLFATGGLEKMLRIWDINTGQMIFECSGHGDLIRDIQFSPDDSLIASSSYDGTIRLWDTKTGKEVNQFFNTLGGAYNIRFFKDGKQLMYSCKGTEFNIISIENWAVLKTFYGHKKQVLAIALSSNEALAASASDDGTVKIWDVATAKCLYTIPKFSYNVLQIEFLNNDTQFVTGSQDGTKRIWTLKDLDSNYTDESDSTFSITYSNCGATSFDFQSFEKTDKIRLKGDAFASNSEIVLTPAEAQKVGVIWYSNPVSLALSWRAEFKFRIDQPSKNNSSEKSLPGADGLAFIIQPHNTDQIGMSGGGLGYEGIPNSFAIEYDLFSNDMDQLENKKDSNGNHIAVQTAFAENNTATHYKKYRIAYNNDIPIIRSDGTIYYSKIEFDRLEKTFKVYLDTTENFINPVIEIPEFSLTDYIELINQEEAFIGISASTGTEWQRHEILSWKFCPEGNDESPNIVYEQRYNDISFYPNPARDYIQFDAEQTTIEIFDIMGVKILENHYVKRIDISNLSPGFYYIKQANKNSKFIKL